MRALQWFTPDRSVIEKGTQASVLELEAERKFHEEKRRLRSVITEREKLRGKVDTIGEQLKEALGNEDERQQQKQRQAEID